LFLGRVGWRKGSFDLIRAIAGLPANIRQQCRLVIAGDGENETARALCRELGCTAEVRIAGWMSTEEVERQLAESDVLLLPSHAEGMALALIEGMSWGLAVVATPVGGAAEFLIDGENCLLVPPGEPAALANAICTLVTDQGLRRHLGDEARKTAARFDVNHYIAKLTSVYETLSGQGRLGHSARALNAPPKRSEQAAGASYDKTGVHLG